MKPSIGRIVHFVWLTSGQHFPAIVTSVRGSTMIVDLQVFTNAIRTGSLPLTELVIGCEYAEDRTKVGTWHWPERED